MFSRVILSALALATLSSAAIADLTKPGSASPAAVFAMPQQGEQESQAPGNWHDMWPGDPTLDTGTSAVAGPAGGKAHLAADRKLAATRRLPSRAVGDRLLGSPKVAELVKLPAPTPPPAPTPERSDGGTAPIGFGDPTPGTRPVPAPGAFLLGALGLAGVNWLKRRGL